LLKLRVWMGVLVAIILLSGVAAAADNAAGKLLLLPLVPGKDVDTEETEKIDGVLGDRMTKFVKLEISLMADFTKLQGDKATRKLIRCGDDIKCLDKILARAPYDLVAVGKAENTGEGTLMVRFRVINLKDGAVKRSKDFEVEHGKFEDKPHARQWTMDLLMPVEALIGEEASAKAEEEAPVTKPSSKARRSELASEQDVADATKVSFQAFVQGNIGLAVQKIKKATENRCGCNADSKAFGLKAMLEAFQVAYNRVETALEKGDSKVIIGNLEEMKTLEHELSGEGKDFQITEPSKYFVQMNTLFGKGYALQAKGFLNAGKYVDARESYQKALEFAPTLKEAKDALEEMPKYAERLFMEGAYMVDYAPEEAKRKIKQVLDIAEKGSDIYKKAEAKLKELDSY